jgi:hypothetical protein
MADFFKGLSGGFQTGMQLGQAVRQRRMQDDLAQEAGRYGVTEGAYGPGLQENIQQLQGLREQDPAQAPAYDEAIRELSRRQGLTAPDYSVASGPTNFATRQEARQAAAPMRAEGLAGVYRQYGDVAQADALEARAFEQQRGIAREARDVAREGRDVRAFETQQAAAERQGLLTEGQITEMNRNQARTKKLDDVDADVAQWQSSRLLDPNTNEPRQPTMDDNIAALQYRATALQKAGLAKEATDSLRDYQGFAVNQIKLDETQRNSQLGAVAAAIAAGDLGPAVAFYDRYVLDGAKVTGMKTDPKTGAITVSRTRDDGGKLPDKVIKGGANELLASLNSFRDPMSLYNFSQNEFTNNLNLRKTVAAEKTAEADVSLKNARAQGLKRDSATLAKLDAIDQQLEAIPPEEMSGPVARGLIMQRNAIVAGATKQVAVGAAPRAERPALSEADATARAKAMVEAREVGPDGKRLTFMQALDIVRGTPPAPDTPASDSASLNSLIGSGRDPFVPAAAAARPTTGLQTQPAPARNAPAEPNPYVDARGRPLAVAPAGAPSIASTAVPAAVSAVEGAVGTQAAATRYLQAKIARNEPLSPTERARAQQMGLIR